jgi:hypothetical protein
MNEKEKESALRSAVISIHFANAGVGLGKNGTDFEHYDSIISIVEKSFDKFSLEFDWEQHRDEGNDDFDAELIKFAIATVVEDKIHYYNKI